jgi:alpha-methylacyl-CoA racemase
MLAHYDVLVEGFKPGTLEKIGIDPQRLLGRYPGLIIARLSGYGQTGPWSQRVGHDLNYVGLSGILSGQKITDDGIALPAAQLADMGGALSAAMGICAALYERQRTGRGRILDISLAESAMSIWAPMITGFNAQGREPKPGREILTGGSSVYGTFECSDGKWISVGIIEPKFQQALKSVCGSLERSKLKEFFLQKPRDHWVDLLENACTAPVLGVCELAEHPQHKARGAIQDGYVRPPFGSISGSVPALGANTVEILEDCSLSADRIDELRRAGIIKS